MATEVIGCATNYLEQKFLNTMRGLNNTYTAPAKVYAGLYKSNPTETGKAGTEVSYQGYARQQITFNAPVIESNRVVIKNNAEKAFPKTTIDVGRITHLGISDALTGGNMLFYGAFSEELDLKAEEAPVLLPNEIIFSVTGDLSNAYKKNLLNVLRNVSINSFTPYMALFKGSPENGGKELSKGGYSRVAIPFSNVYEESGISKLKNSSTIKFNRTTDNIGETDYRVIYDNITAGNPVWYKAQPVKDIRKGRMVIYETGAIEVGIN